jgi:hypothetical protein
VEAMMISISNTENMATTLNAMGVTATPRSKLIAARKGIKREFAKKKINFSESAQIAKRVRCFLLIEDNLARDFKGYEGCFECWQAFACDLRHY